MNCIQYTASAANALCLGYAISLKELYLASTAKILCATLREARETSFLSAILSRDHHVPAKMDALQERDKARNKTERKRDLLALRSKDVQLKLRKYDRQRSRVSTKGLKDRKLTSHIKTRAKQSEHAAVKAARAELLLLDEPG